MAMCSLSVATAANLAPQAPQQQQQLWRSNALVSWNGGAGGGKNPVNAANRCSLSCGRQGNMTFRAAIAQASTPLSWSGNGEFGEEEYNEDADSFSYLVSTVQCILHFKYRVGHTLDEYDAKLIQEEVLRFHPRAAEKIGCGVASIMINYHPDYNRSRCFMINRLDESVCDFSYRKCMLERARLKGIHLVAARKLLNMDYINISDQRRSPE
ncbi:uncharacterized protein LOC9651091 isoform X3 [Selaginella moellendorffii]|uniref:uncharacterized protein LOC9651091 isoform X3 n=1 Tax=Selaginella moellendorffii TaxID=88036 RepID=UPI000D1C5F9C|nr:uncharacterized protein LOC9651091 isoform X3 [Selaginella moellendorffii]|eukprot:XP_024518933.1 uncharacterized protein LOC9651091 isoform X3 [Selaginella moellendorffii]